MFMVTKQLNPCYFWLFENLKAEQAIAKSREDLDSYSKILASSAFANNPNLKNDFAWLSKKIEGNKFSPRYSTSVAVCLYLNKSQNLNLSKSFKIKAIELLGKLGELGLPAQKYLEAFYYLRDLKYDTQSILDKLIDFRDSSIEKKDIDFLLEFDFVLPKDLRSSQDWDRIDIDSPSFNLSKISKLGLILTNPANNKGNIEKILTNVEKKCYQTFEDLSIPAITLAIYEAEKIISTNLDSDKLDALLHVLKKQNKNWSSLISEIKKDGVTVDLEKVNGLLKLSLEDSLWTIELFHKTGRKETYQIGNEDVKEFLIFRKLKNEGNLVTSIKSLLLFIVFNIFSIMIIWLYIWKALLPVFYSSKMLFSMGAALPVALILLLIRIHVKFWKTGKFDIFNAIDDAVNKILNK